MQSRPLGLSDHQLMQVKAAASTLLPSARSDFLEGLSKRLGDEPSDAALQLAIAQQLSVNRLQNFLCDSKTGQDT